MRVQFLQGSAVRPPVPLHFLRVSGMTWGATRLTLFEGLLEWAYWSGVFGLPLFSSPGDVAGGCSPAVAPGVVPAGGVEGGVALEPEGTAASPFEFGSGVSAAKADVLIITIVASSKFCKRVIRSSSLHLGNLTLSVGNCSGEERRST
jgi:hypothetical protein